MQQLTNDGIDIIAPLATMAIKITPLDKQVKLCPTGAMMECSLYKLSHTLFSLGAPDYHPVPSMEFFGELSTASFRKECVTISIANDTVLEDTESFDVVLSSSDSVVNITRRVSRVHIIDDDGVRVGLKERTLTVSEGEGATIPICVELVGRIQHNIEAVVTTSPLSAHGENTHTHSKYCIHLHSLHFSQLTVTITLFHTP